MNAEQATRSTSTALAIFSAISLGALSFIGMLLITASWPWAIVAFLLASVIEGEIFKQMIQGAIRSLLLVGPITELYQSIAKRELYQNSKKYRKHMRYGNKAALRAMEEAFIRKIMYAQLPATQGISAIRERILKEVRRKKFVLYISAILAIGASISSALATISAASAGMITLGVAATIASGGAIGIGIISGIGYAFIMYKSLSDMVQNDSLQHFVKKTRSFFSFRHKESTLRFLARCIPMFIGVTAVVALAAFATLATAGTWWFAVKRGAALIGVMEKAISALRTVTVICMAIPAFIFNAGNALSSIVALSASSWKIIKSNLGAHYLDPLQHKNIIQKINPFYWVNKTAQILFHAAVFIGHLISVGLTSDALPGVSPEVSTAGGTLIEFLTDWHFLFEFGDTHAHDHSHDDHHGHHHSNLPSLLASVVLLPILVLSKAWDWLFSRGNQAAPLPTHQHAHHHHHHHDHDHCDHNEEDHGADTSSILSLLETNHDRRDSEEKFDDLPELVDLNAPINNITASSTNDNDVNFARPNIRK